MVLPRDLAENPQRFWARGVVFRDTLQSLPASKAVFFNDRPVYSFRTKTLGLCYAEPAAADEIRRFGPGRELIFTATVVNETKGLIRKQTVYRVVVQQVQQSVGGAEEMARLMRETELLAGVEGPHAPRIKVLRLLLTRVQEDLTVRAANERVDRASFFDPNSPYFEQLLSAARAAVVDLEKETGIPAREHLVQFVVALAFLAEQRPAPSQGIAPETVFSTPAAHLPPDDQSGAREAEDDEESLEPPDSRAARTAESVEKEQQTSPSRSDTGLMPAREATPFVEHRRLTPPSAVGVDKATPPAVTGTVSAAPVAQQVFPRSTSAPMARPPVRLHLSFPVADIVDRALSGHDDSASAVVSESGGRAVSEEPTAGPPEAGDETDALPIPTERPESSSSIPVETEPADASEVVTVETRDVRGTAPIPAPADPVSAAEKEQALPPANASSDGELTAPPPTAEPVPGPASPAEPPEAKRSDAVEAPAEEPSGDTAIEEPPPALDNEAATEPADAP